MPGQVTMIPATREMYTGIPTAASSRRRVAAYARVSTDSEEQFTSYEAQVDYYTKLIESRSDWECAGVYTDEGISGLMTKHRDGFNQMINDALAGSIDLIITKSVSRFARNTVDSLTTIRKLKDKGVEVFFEKENIYSLDSKGELLLTLMSSLAQEESRSLSQNVTWGQRKRFSDGKVTMAYKSFLGYKKGADGRPEVDPEEATIVRRIYSEYIHGASVRSIAQSLTEDGIPTPAGKEVWPTSTVTSILRNEKYKGDALLQKSFTVDFLQKKMKQNEGEVPQYYVEGSHPAIISPNEWELVQREMSIRNNCKKYTSDIFSGKIVCGDCGNIYGAKVWHSNSKYRKVIYQCNHKFKGEKCSTPHLSEDRIKELFIDVYSEYYDDKAHIIEDLNYLLENCFDTDKLESKLQKLEESINNVANKLRELIEQNASASIQEDEYREKYAKLHDEHTRLKDRYNKDSLKLIEVEREMLSLREVIEMLSGDTPLPMEFDQLLFRNTVDKVVVKNDGTIEYHLTGGKVYIRKI